MITTSSARSPQRRSWRRSVSSRSSPRRSWSGATPPSSPRPAVTDGPSLEISGVAKQFGRFPALNGVSLTIERGEFLALLGPSGSGKTTLLRVLAGLEQPDAGQVNLGDEDFLALSPRQRRVGMVFQHYALFRHMTVEQNIAFGLNVRPRAERPAKEDVRRRVHDLLGLIQLDGLGGRYPAQLSGGQRQRVALARALAIEPRVLLLDEPFGALDAQVRRDLRRWLREVHQRTGVTTVFVTHDQEEALDLADRVAVLREGSLAQLGRPQELYDHPADPFVYQFVGPTCRLDGVVENGRLLAAGWDTTAPKDIPDGKAVLMFRPGEVEIGPPEDDGLKAELLGVVRRGVDVRLECSVGGELLEVETDAGALPEVLSVGGLLTLKPLRPQAYPA
jgi:sulfate transport system ATP-binding protein